MAKILFQDGSIGHYAPNVNIPERNFVHSNGHHEEVPSVSHAWLVNRITTHLDRSVALIMSNTDEVQTKQQCLINLLIDVLRLQPDETIIDVIIGCLGKYGITAYRYIPKCHRDVVNHREAYRRLRYYRQRHGMDHERCLVRLGPIILELLNTGGYSELLRGARDLCRLKHSDMNLPSVHTTG